MPRFSEELLARVRAGNDIVQVVGEKVTLKQSGKEFVGLCPFHDEKTPSFSVNSEKQFYHCFGCGAGGSIFDFLMESEGLSFTEAVQILADRAGVALPASNVGDGEANSRPLYDINHTAARYFYRMLRSSSGQAARRYLTQRGVTGELAKRFLLGYAPSDWSGLVQFLDGQGVALSEAERAGLVIRGKNGSWYDRFRGRIVFPICDHRGRFVGFGARALGDEQPKYLNTPETAVFSKSRQLYGLNWAKDAIRNNDAVVLVEGYTDCIGLYKSGVKNVVASLGTAFGAAHAKLLSRFTRNLILAFDGDAAGEKASKRGVLLLTNEGLNVRVALLPPGEDPDSFARSHTAGEVAEWLDSAMPLLEHLVSDCVQRHSADGREGKLMAAREIVGLLGQIKSPLVRTEYIRFAAGLLDMREDVLRDEVKQTAELKPWASAKSWEPSPSGEHEQKFRNVPGKPTAERELLRWLLSKPALIEDAVKRGLRPSDFVSSDYGHLFSLLTQGQWDRHGEDVSERLFVYGGPLGDFEEYLDRFQADVWQRDLTKIEEKLPSVENATELGKLLHRFYQIRRQIQESAPELHVRRKGGKSHEQQ